MTAKAKASYQVFHKVARLLYKFKEIQPGVFVFFFDKRGIAKSAVINEHFNGKLFSIF